MPILHCHAVMKGPFVARGAKRPELAHFCRLARCTKVVRDLRYYRRAACVGGGPPANRAGGGLAGGALGGRERGEPAIEFVDIELLRVEVAAAPFEQFRVTLVLWIRDGVQELAVAPGTADVLGRTTPGAL